MGADRRADGHVPLATVDGIDGGRAGDAGQGAGQRRAGNAGVGRYAVDDATDDGYDAGMAGGCSLVCRGHREGIRSIVPLLTF